MRARGGSTWSGLEGRQSTGIRDGGQGPKPHERGILPACDEDPFLFEILACTDPHEVHPWCRT